jgi:hypothetical protein
MRLFVDEETYNDCNVAPQLFWKNSSHAQLPLLSKFSLDRGGQSSEFWSLFSRHSIILAFLHFDWRENVEMFMTSVITRHHRRTLIFSNAVWRVRCASES